MCKWQHVKTMSWWYDNVQVVVAPDYHVDARACLIGGAFHRVSHTHTPIKHMSDTCQTHVRHMLDTFRHLSDTCQTPVRYLSDPCQTPVRHLSDTCETPVRHMSDTCQLHVRHMSDICFHVSHTRPPFSIWSRERRRQHMTTDQWYVDKCFQTTGFRATGISWEVLVV